MRRCGTCQGNDHCLRPAPSLAPFGAATRLVPKREQTLIVRIKLIAVGSRMPRWVEEGWQEYVKRLPGELPL